MGLSGFLYVAIVVGWAVYLVPFALKRYDEAARNRSIDRFSSAMRVLGRREDAADEQAEEPRRAKDDGVTRPTPRPAPDANPRRTTARTAARRRRRVLLLLTLTTAGIATAAWFMLLPWWSVAVPAALLLLWLVVCPVQARRERRTLRAARAGHDAGQRGRQLQDAPGSAVARSEPGVDVTEDGQDITATTGPAADPAVAAQPAPPADEEPTVVLDRSRGDSDTVGTGSLWDPVPVTLPTYVHKPRAPRTIRTIDLGAAGVQSSARADDATRTDEDGGTSEHDGDQAQRPTSARAVGE